MKLTWFGSTAFRIHIGGQVVVVDAEAAPNDLEQNEILSGADTRILSFGAAIESVDPLLWQPRKTPRLLDDIDGGPAFINAWRLSDGGILIDAIGEPPLIFLSKYEVPKFASWSEKAVVVLVGKELRERTENMRDATCPRLLALAGDSHEVEETFEHLEDRLFGMALLALEPGLAVEV